MLLSLQSGHYHLLELCRLLVCRNSFRAEMSYFKDVDWHPTFVPTAYPLGVLEYQHISWKPQERPIASPSSFLTQYSTDTAQGLRDLPTSSSPHIPLYRSTDILHPDHNPFSNYPYLPAAYTPPPYPTSEPSRTGVKGDHHGSANPPFRVMKASRGFETDRVA